MPTTTPEKPLLYRAVVICQTDDKVLARSKWFPLEKYARKSLAYLPERARTCKICNKQGTILIVSGTGEENEGE